MCVSCRNGIFHRDVKPENILIRVGLYLFRTDNMLINHFPAELFAKRIKAFFMHAIRQHWFISFNGILHRLHVHGFIGACMNTQSSIHVWFADRMIICNRNILEYLKYRIAGCMFDIVVSLVNNQLNKYLFFRRMFSNQQILVLVEVSTQNSPIQSTSPQDGTYTEPNFPDLSKTKENLTLTRFYDPDLYYYTCSSSNISFVSEFEDQLHSCSVSLPVCQSATVCSDVLNNTGH